MGGGDGGQRRPGHVNHRRDALPRPGVIGDPFGLAASTGSAVIRLDEIDGAVVDEALKPFLQPEAILAGEQGVLV